MNIRIRNMSKRAGPPGPASRLCVIAAAVMSLIPSVGSATATLANATDDHSANTTEVASLPLGDGLADIAFWGDLAVVSRFSGSGTVQDGAAAGFSVVDISTPESPVELSRFVCTGGGWDVSVWEDLVFLSVDGYTATTDDSCSSAPRHMGIFNPAPNAGVSRSGFEGLKIVSIADPASPVQVGSVPLLCSGSHTNTVIPDLKHNRLLIYAASLIHPLDWPPDEVAQGCDMIVEVPLGNPSGAGVIGRLPVGHGRVTQCHDMTYFAPRKLLAAACYTEWRLYDISDPVAPELLSVTANPLSFQHGAAFSNDGNTLVTGDEGQFYEGDGAACHGGTGSTNGAIWFYDITNPALPVLHGYHSLQHGFEAKSPGGAGGCSAHYFNIVPTRSDRDILVSAWYAGGMSAVDFTDIDAPTEIAFYQPNLNDPARRAFYWSAYWYRDHVYASNGWLSQRRSLDVFRINDPVIGDTYRLPHLNPQSQEALVGSRGHRRHENRRRR